ncbi:S-adenosyl-L-methionine-dependent methyltransferase [Wolfiporia cocos MD-104 SS10]|uniref:S-adenosyl-L-methionine-dependent methyltransferase n=1 Tax=Wolfiporia cocos (strain MD-104) TaxID=742152 RepID=A0A2H3JGX2_WOLCO|nr:S-adenosyl-L-methionine-dependent methyltransferase [Wolfiporia cocos MD-104 SS10]
MRLRSIIGEHQADGWDKAWQDGVTPWDSGCPQPALQDLITSGKLDLPRSGRALVPGCGRGYDTLVIATALGLDTLGIDISSTALEAAERVSFQLKDFLALSGTGDEHYELIYDYTFFVAIPPTRRPEWGRQMTKIVKSGGYLITLLFPIINQPENVGPPFYAREESYAAVLGADWENVLDEIPENSIESHKGVEQLIVWKRK